MKAQINQINEWIRKKERKKLTKINYAFAFLELNKFHWIHLFNPLAFFAFWFPQWFDLIPVYLIEFKLKTFSLIH